MKSTINLLATCIQKMNQWPLWPVALLMRLGMATVFWRAGQVKISDWNMTLGLFRDEYKVPLLPYEWAAILATACELILPVFLLLGFATRGASLALLGMTLVIQFFIYPDTWPTTLLWSGPLLYLICRGPGLVSIDHWIEYKWGRKATNSNY